MTETPPTYWGETTGTYRAIPVVCWTATPPTAPGWCWWRPTPAHEAKVVEVSPALRVNGVSLIGMSGEWAGPLTPPA